MAPEPVAWDVASRVARQLLSRRAPLDPAARADLERDFAAATARAEQLVEAETGLRSAAGPTRAVVADRAAWVEVNIASFRRLLAPMAARLEQSAAGRRALSPASRAAAGVEVGLLLAWMSGRVLGQYDLAAADGSDGDVVYFVAENIVALESKHGFDPAPFRLWIALHEVTHRLQFTGVEWLRPYFLSLVDRGVELAPPDISAVLESLRRAAAALLAGNNPLADGGVVGLFATSDQLATLRDAQALMSLLEGHGDVVMNAAAAAEIPDASRFSTTLHERRSQSSGAAKFVQQLLGIDAKMRQYAEGERFVDALIAAGGDDLLRLVWSGPELLPNLEEIRDPERWIARTRERATTRA